MSVHAFDRRPMFFAFLAYLAFVVYGSLVPFELRPHTLDEAIRKFSGIGYLNLGAASRADWVANIVLYIPLSFLGCAWSMGMRPQAPLRHLAALLIIMFCLTVAVGLEFTQIFFAPRTVSLNDLLAETLGTLGGVALFTLGRWRIARLLEAFASGGRESVVAAAFMYALLYVALSLFPYDFVISPKELAWKLNSGNQGWLTAGNCGNWLRCTAHQFSEAVILIPLGILIALAAPALGYRRLFLAGAGLGLVLELLQLLLVSGTSQGLSLLWRGVGLAAGAAVGRILRRYGPAPIAGLVRWAIPFAVLPYILALVALSGWFSAPWLSLPGALARLAGVRFLPFYYHYFTTESAAMASVFAQACMYAPVGLAAWALRAGRSGGSGGSGARSAALWAASLALLVELGKLFVPPKHPDFTDLVIVAASAALTCALANWMGLVLLGGPPGHGRREAAAPAGSRPAAPAGAPASRTRYQTPPRHWVGIVIGCAAMLPVLAGLALYPVGTAWLAAGLLIYGGLLWYRPSALFFVIPALLPTLDLGPVTGRLPLDEFDLAVLVTFAVAYPRLYPMKPLPWSNGWWPAAVVLLWASWVLASARGLSLLPGAEGAAASSHSPLEAWLVGKGLFWALLFIPILRRVPLETAKAVQGRVLDGFTAGLAAVSLLVLRERHIFVGLANFENAFRVTGPFSSMSTGGAYIEAFLAFAFPALAVRVLMARSPALKTAGIAVAALAAYAMLVTFSRGGYAGFLAGLLPVLLGMFLFRNRFPARRWPAFAGMAAALVATSIPVLSGGFAQYRLAQAPEDFSRREAHWAHALGLMDDGPMAVLTGMGFGQYPRLYLMRAEGGRPPGTYSVVRGGGNPYLRLGAGESVYLDQIVEIEPGARYTLSARIRRPDGAGPLNIALCEKALLYSFECIWHRLQPADSERGWGTASVPVNAAQLGAGGGWPHRPVKLSLHNPRSGAPIDVDDVSLRTTDGRELVANGGFGRGIARWLFVADQQQAWHIDQQAVEMYVAQGLLGLLAFAVLLTAVAKALWPALLGGDLQAAACAGALAGFLAVGLLGSTMDAARLSMLFYFGAFCAGLLTHRRTETARVADIGTIRAQERDTIPAGPTPNRRKKPFTVDQGSA
jgi:VanZ family protein